MALYFFKWSIVWYINAPWTMLKTDSSFLNLTSHCINCIPHMDASKHHYFDISWKMWLRKTELCSENTLCRSLFSRNIPACKEFLYANICRGVRINQASWGARIHDRPWGGNYSLLRITTLHSVYILHNLVQSGVHFYEMLTWQHENEAHNMGRYLPWAKVIRNI